MTVTPVTVDSQKANPPKRPMTAALERMKAVIDKAGETMNRAAELIRADGPRHSRLTENKVRISDK